MKNKIYKHLEIYTHMAKRARDEGRFHDWMILENIIKTTPGMVGKIVNEKE